MTEAIAHFLLSTEGRKLVDSVDGESDLVRALARLRKTIDPEKAAAVLEVGEARRRSLGKFGELSASMYFTTEALEQASSAGASTHHARRMVDAGIEVVIDLCGGVGADALAFARAGLRVILCEIDPVRALFAAENARVSGFPDQIDVRCVDSTAILHDLRSEFPESLVVSEPLGPDSSPSRFGRGGEERAGVGPAIWFDPARRDGSRRIVDPDDYRPPLSLIETLRAAGFNHIGAKLAPAVDHALQQTYRGELEFISDQGECKEGILWTGKLDTGVGLRATVIGKTAISTLTGLSHDDSSSPSLSKGGGWGEGYLYEPDPAVIRAHLVQNLGQLIDARPIDPHIAYLIGQGLVETPFATAYAIIDRFPFHLKALNRRLRELSVGRVVIKKRGFPQEPGEVRKQLKLTGDQEMTLVLTRVDRQHQVILCRPVKG